MPAKFKFSMGWGREEIIIKCQTGQKLMSNSEIEVW